LDESLECHETCDSVIQVTVHGRIHLSLNTDSSWIQKRLRFEKSIWYGC